MFIVSAIVWMLMPHHKNDFSPPDDQDALMKAVRRTTSGPGMYYFPWAGPEGEQSDALQTLRGDTNPGKKSSKSNQDCTICRSYRGAVIGSVVLEWRENRVEWREFGGTPLPYSVVISTG